MKLLKRLVAATKRITNKKLKRRTRVRIKQHKNYGHNRVTDAQLLIQSNYGIRFSNPPAKREGVKRQEVRIAKHRRQWNDTPVSNKVSRQVRRCEASQ